MAGKDGPKIVVNIDTTQLDEAIAKVQKLLDMLYEADNLAPGILRGGDANAKQD
jgi:hypothetical protein